MKTKNKCPNKYEIVVDYGKPYGIEVCGKTPESARNKLKKEVRKIRRQAESMDDDFPYFDVWVYKGSKQLKDSTIRKWSGMKE
jgi:hypothetical protein